MEFRQFGLTAVALVAIVGIGAGVIVMGGADDFQSFATFATPALVALVAVIGVDRIKGSVQKIEENTNGKLDRRIRDNVRYVLNEDQEVRQDEWNSGESSMS